MKKILITGSSGFIGMHLCTSLIKDGYDVIGIDNMNNYYDTKLKEDRLKMIKKHKNFKFFKKDINDFKAMYDIFSDFRPNKVVNLAAQAGVRYSLENPRAYIDTNIVGFFNILEVCKTFDVSNLVYASSSSVYGGNKNMPFSITDAVKNPISIYAASKRTNELMANVYSRLHGLKTTGLRFFTVYGPWGRPDMAMYLFSEKIMKGLPIEVFNYGKMGRDFTFIDDIIQGLKSSLDKNYDNQIFNLGNNQIEKLLDMISILEKNLGKKAKISFRNLQPGDVQNTCADISHSQKMLNYNPKTPLKIGIPIFIDWYKKYIRKTI